MKTFKRLSAFALSLVVGLSIIGTSQVYTQEEVTDGSDMPNETIVEDMPTTEEPSTEEETEEPVEETPTEEPNNEVTSNEITDWKWNDPDGNLVYSQENQRWELNAPGASEENPLTQEALISMLPTQITVTLSNEQQVVFDITWDLSSIPAEGVWEDELNIVATINDPENLLEGKLTTLDLSLVLGEAETLSIPTGTIENAPFRNHIIDNNTDASGTTINLFDYWLYDRDTNDSNDGGNVSNRGINKGHALNFRDSGGNDVAGRWNDYTNSSKPYQGIVARNLGDNGYPMLNNLEVPLGYNGNESLQYLFDPLVEHDGKISYSDVDGLLRVNDDGYLEYSSDSNYAVFYPGSNAFALYNAPGALTNITGEKRGEFFPFDSADEVFDERNNSLVDNGSGYENGKNHYFGLNMSTRFIQQYGGYTSENKRTPVTYEFSGDDDVWVFIDNVLVADLGGIHGAGDLSINFATGVVEVEGQQSTIRRQFELAGASIDGFNGNTFADDTYHTLKFYYLERGNGASNMSLKFNLVTVPESDIIKVDQLGDPVPGATFDLYAANEQYEIGQKIATGTTGDDGSFILVDDEGYTISLNDLFTRGIKHLVLRETATPSGYRNAGDMRLELYNGNGNVVLLSENHWETGAYSSAKLTAKAPNSVTTKYPITNNEGTMFAVVMKYAGDGTPNQASLRDLSQWLPISGDPVKEDWHVADNSSMQSILNAAKANPYIFQVDSSGAYKVEIENMPGNIRNYYFMSDNKSNVQYVVMYFYAKGVTSLNQIQNANDIQHIIETEYNAGEFSREFAARLYVPNIKNNLLIQKVDEDGTPVTGAQFTLTSKEASAEFTPRIVTTDNLTKDPQTGEGVNLQGGAVIEGIPKGNYILTETSAPEGFAENTSQIEVIVDDTGVYANAGTDKDGVDVLRGAGSIVKTMVQFATNDNLNTTLHDIKAELMTSENYPTAGWESADKETHLQYDAQGAALEYGPASDEYDLALMTTSGWSKLKIQQCLDHQQNEEISGDKENLEDTDLTNLFSGSVTVRVENKRVGSLTISKTVVDESDIAEDDLSYTFNLYGTNASETPLNGKFNVEKYDASLNPTQDSVTFTDGKATINLKDGEKIIFTNLPNESKIDVYEDTTDATFSTSYIVNDGSSMKEDGIDDLQITSQNAVNIAFTNTYEPTAKFAFKKIDASDSPLSDASFGVYELVCTESSHNHNDDELVINDAGKITEVNKGDKNCWKETSTSTSTGDGIIDLENLKISSEYRLVEYKAPGGYLLPSGQWYLKYNMENEQFEITGSTNESGTPAYEQINDDENEGIYYQVKNYKPGELPLTGNRGIGLFLLAGSSLMLLGGIILILRHKRRVI
ncbi:SpaA isopeptide-forming pilin-related protein [Faecalicoccus pleomorphus]|uniref:SpaA isopeptide-forming pilin-related protein n=1 Tax=Faecalicoccus pleomorphus TaxID=1323 RepID=UPI0024324348|nr:SpaA isopeptide-forming pilin-related protein [Faecalicoccus pleomorphus]